MKYLPLLLILVACHPKGKTHHPPVIADILFIDHVVHNSCTGLWAVETGIDSIYKYRVGKNDTFWTEPHFLGKDPYDGFQWEVIDKGEMVQGRMHVRGDTVDNARTGEELQFSDSTSASLAYAAYKHALAFKAERLAEAKRKLARDEFIADSIFRCNHTYSP